MGNMKQRRLYKINDLATYMHVQILKWAELRVRTFDNRIQKRIVEGSFGGKMPTGRPRNGWEDEQGCRHIAKYEKTGSQRTDIGVTGGRKTWRP